jgi:hypothetical protein
MPENTRRDFLRLAAAASLAATNGRLLWGRPVRACRPGSRSASHYQCGNRAKDCVSERRQALELTLKPESVTSLHW